MKVKQKTTTDKADIINIDKVRKTALLTDPYDYILLSDFILPEWQDRLLADYPVVKKGGSFPLASVKYGADFKKLIEQMNSKEFRQTVEEKFSVSLEGKPTMFTVRGKCRLKDGKIHTDSESKIITVLLYMNPAWQNQGGKLRILRSGTNIEDVVAEVPPTIGTLLIFKRSNYSFHGHLPFDGERKVIQMNWVTEQKFVDREAKRHGLSSFLKNFGISY